jgi:hypothetical protein
VWPRKSSKKDDSAKKAPVTPAPAKAAKAAKPRQPSPPADVYTFFLAIALIAVLVAILFLCLEMSPYDFKFKGGPPVVRIEIQGAPDGRVRETHQSMFSECRVGETHPSTLTAVRFPHATIT